MSESKRPSINSNGLRYKIPSPFSSLCTEYARLWAQKGHVRITVYALVDFIFAELKRISSWLIDILEGSRCQKRVRSTFMTIIIYMINFLHFW